MPPSRWRGDLGLWAGRCWCDAVLARTSDAVGICAAPILVSTLCEVLGDTVWREVCRASALSAGQTCRAPSRFTQDHPPPIVVHVSLPFGSWLWAGKAVIHSTVSFACANAQFGFVSNVGATEWDLFHLKGPISLSAAELELVFNSILLGCEFIKWDYTVKCTPSSTDESVWNGNVALQAVW